MAVFNWSAVLLSEGMAWFRCGWNLGEIGKQAGAQQPQWPAFIGLFFSECLMIRCSPTRWCTFVLLSFINPVAAHNKSLQQRCSLTLYCTNCNKSAGWKCSCLPVNSFWKSICALVIYTYLLVPGELVYCDGWQLRNREANWNWKLYCLEWCIHDCGTSECCTFCLFFFFIEHVCSDA